MPHSGRLLLTHVKFDLAKMFEWENALAYFIRLSMAKILYIEVNPLHQIKGFDR
jgi:hypothetical protein